MYILLWRVVEVDRDTGEYDEDPCDLIEGRGWEEEEETDRDARKREDVLTPEFCGTVIP